MSDLTTHNDQLILDLEKIVAICDYLTDDSAYSYEKEYHVNTKGFDLLAGFNMTQQCLLILSDYIGSAYQHARAIEKIIYRKPSPTPTTGGNGDGLDT